jgi:hypothetical protein
MSCGGSGSPRPRLPLYEKVDASVVPFAMQSPVRERVQKLREEIANISEANRMFIIKNSRDAAAGAEQERRLQRLQEILKELRSLTDWKET